MGEPFFDDTLPASLSVAPMILCVAMYHHFGVFRAATA